ncbi:polysaccharide deacetylase family protein [bacterium]|nr:polysaccharide deacetylase family protein [bacterium]
MTPGSAKPLAAVSMDVDTLTTLLGDAYTGPDDTFCRGLETCLTELARWRLPVTFFVVGRDLSAEPARQIVREMAQAGHEIASHSFTHPQGFRQLRRDEKEMELQRAEESIHAATGNAPVGFRAPGWNVDSETTAILAGRGYRYDSSVFPTLLAPLLKCAHWWANRTRPPAARTTLGDPNIFRAPRTAYRPDRDHIWKRGRLPLIEIPIATTPFWRLPCYGTTLFQIGESRFRPLYDRIRRECLASASEPGPRPAFVFQMHLAEWVDAPAGGLNRHLRPGARTYIPAALRMPLAAKRDIYRRFLTTLCGDFDTILMKDLASRFEG